MKCRRFPTLKLVDREKRNDGVSGTVRLAACAPHCDVGSDPRRGGEVPNTAAIQQGFAQWSSIIDGSFYWGIAGVPGSGGSLDQIPSSDNSEVNGIEVLQ
jgi:hypothetical protein